MSQEKLFTVAGVATNPDGTVKVRFANDLVSRIKILIKNNCTEIDLVELPSPMTKLQALQHLKTLNRFEGDAAAVIDYKINEKSLSSSVVRVAGVRPEIVELMSKHRVEETEQA